MSLVERANRYLAQQRAMSELHPLLGKAHPLGIVDSGTIWIHDVVSPHEEYTLVAEMPGPPELPDGFVATVELPAYPGKATISVAAEMVHTPQGQARIMGAVVQVGLEERYQREAMAWLGVRDPDSAYELHAFQTTHDSAWLYRTLVSALQGNAPRGRISRLREEIRALCTDESWAMLLFREWREGTARYIENQARARLGLGAAPVDLGPYSPFAEFDEDLLVGGGAALIAWLDKQEPGISYQPLALLKRMEQLGA